MIKHHFFASALKCLITSFIHCKVCIFLTSSQTLYLIYIYEFIPMLAIHIINNF